MIERVDNKPIEHPVEKGWFKHPELPIWMSATEDSVLTKDGFVKPSTGGEYKYYIRKHIHQLKLETFLKKPTNLVKIYGNHIDGNKFNNLLSNLEWVTTTGNIKHAYDTGLRRDNNRGLLFDLLEGTVKSFTTQKECAKYLNLNQAVLTRWLQSSRKTPIKYKYCIKLDGEPSISLTKKDVGKVRRNENLPVVLTKDKETKYFVTHSNIKRFLGTTSNELRNKLNTGETIEGWSLRNIVNYDEYVKAFEEDEMYKKLISNHWFSKQSIDKRKSSKRVCITNTLAKTKTEYESIYEFADKCNHSSSEINRALMTKNSWREFIFEFLE